MFCQYVLLFVAAASVGRVTCWKAVIKNPYTGYVLDGTGDNVKLQPYKGTPEQFWSVRQVGDNEFYFLNRASSKLLDIQGEPKSKANVIRAEIRLGDQRQKWIKNSDDNTIVNFVYNNLALDVEDNDMTPGANIIVYPRDGGRNQKFILEPDQTVDD